MKKLLTVILLLACSITGFAQSKNDIAKARQLMILYDYDGAISLLEKAIKKAKVIDREALEVLADCYFRIRDYTLAEQTYGRLMELGTSNMLAHKQYGEVLIFFGRYEDAKKQFRDSGVDPVARRMMVACDTALSWMSQGKSARFAVENEAGLNTQYHEWGATPMKNGRSVVYISDRPFGRKAYSGILRPFTSQIPAGGSSREVEATPMFTSSFKECNFGPLTYAPDGQRVFYSRTNESSERKVKEQITIRERELIIEEATITNNGKEDRLNQIYPFDYNKPSEYSVGHPCLSSDGKVLYFASNMPGGYGGTDIYYSIRTANAWSIPVNVGPRINTEGDERFPTVGENGVLYFSSNGHPGYGGLDIFRAEGEKNTWRTVENLYAPINSSGDDFYLSFIDETSGFLASNRAGGKGGDDIYSVTSVTPKQPVVVTPVVTPPPPVAPPPVVVQPKEEKVAPKYFGLVREENTLSPIDGASVRAVHKKNNSVIQVTSLSDGSFVLDLQEDSEYMISCSKDGYELASFDLQTNCNQSRQLKLYMKQAAPKVILVPDNGQGTGIDYRVQIQANNTIPPDESYWIAAQNAYPQYKIVFKHDNDGFTRYTMGQFKQLKDANKLKTALRAMGYYDAFVVKYEDGKRAVVSYH
ncbi:MAG: hypothetical protein LBF19_00225 [Prevotellaceae bacterium]|jgi:hypothetical protein|nr:hypothetical protein [Prevotellaceae bacterium]